MRLLIAISLLAGALTGAPAARADEPMFSGKVKVCEWEGGQAPRRLSEAELFRLVPACGAGSLGGKSLYVADVRCWRVVPGGIWPLRIKRLDRMVNDSRQFLTGHLCVSAGSPEALECAEKPALPSCLDSTAQKRLRERFSPPENRGALEQAPPGAVNDPAT